NLEREESRRNWDDVDDALRQAERLSPLPPSVAILRADYLANQRKFAEATDSLIKRYDKKASRPVEVWVALAGLEDWQGQPAKAKEYLDDARTHVGDSVDLRLARADHLVRQNQGKARDELLALGTDADRFAVAD